QAAADAGTDEIATPQTYTNTSNPQDIWVRLEDNATGCYKLGQFQLVVSQGAAITDPLPFTLCDDLGEPNDGFTVFDLTLKNDEITGGDLSIGVGYYESEADAQDDVDRIDPDTAYQNLTNPQTLWVRAEDSDSGCVAYT